MIEWKVTNSMEKKLYEKPQVEILMFVPSATVQTGYVDGNGNWVESGPQNDGDIIVPGGTTDGNGGGGWIPFF